MNKTLAAALLATSTLTFGAASAQAEAVKFALDPSHSQIVFTWNHLGYSTTTGMYSGFEGDIMFDAEDPAASSVSVTFPAEGMITGWDARTQHFLQSGDFFKLDEAPEVTFESTGIEVTGDATAKITGDLTINGVTKSVVLDTVLNKQAEYPFGPTQGQMALGFDATTTVVRSEFNLGAFAPAIGDEVKVQLSIEAVAE
ncbi:YceI family protein [Oceaniglobus indicus]|uniref:YceI family protein n=1 Tax=Oceaniglobus indicus TaxID=2047749 RepID=UPI000C177EE4|nr:YceI family protein [Oceaniglobus indicus]